MANLQKLIDLDGLSYFLGQIKAKFVRSVNGAKPDSKGNVNIANMEGATSNAAGKAGLVPAPLAGKQDMALCGDATFKVLPVEGGGTGLTSNPSMLINLASAVASNVFQTSSSPGVTGVLSIANGGTGANTVSAACKALGLDFDWFHRYGENYVPSNVTNDGWNSLGLSLIYYTQAKKISNQPSTYGQLLNIPAAKNTESTQIWIEQSSGNLYVRGGNGSININDTAFTKVATLADVSSAGSGIVAANLAQNGYVKFSNGLILQWGMFNTEWKGTNTVKFNIAYSNRCLIVMSTSITDDGYNGYGKIIAVNLTQFKHKHEGNAHPYYYVSIGY